MSITVLLVEDDPVFRETLSQVVQDAPDMSLIGVASDLADGMALLEQGPVDIFLIDLGLPDGSGLTLIREIVKRWPKGCEVMVISMFSDAHHVLPAILAGAKGYLLKDETPAEMAQRIRELHAGGSPMTASIARHVLNRLAPAGGKGPLTDAEHKVLVLITRGKSRKEVAKALGVSEETVKSHLNAFYRKLHVKSKTEAIYAARAQGIELDFDFD